LDRNSHYLSILDLQLAHRLSPREKDEAMISPCCITYVVVFKKDHREFQKRADPRVGDVLVSKDGTLGVSRIVEERHPEFSIFVSVALLRPICTLLRPRNLHLFFDSGTYEKQLGKLSAGTGLKHIHLEHFRRFLIPLPIADEQDRIAALADATDAKLGAEENHCVALRCLKAGLMHDLLSGRVRVPVPAESRGPIPT
jgi:type I restriction enzyme S subunit